MGKKGKRGRDWQGSVWKRSDQRWGAELPVQTPEGKKYRATTKRTEEEAVRWLNQMRYERDEGLLSAVDTKNPTVAAFLRRWLAGSVEGTVSRHTYYDYKNKVEKHIVPMLGSKKLKDLTHQDLQMLYRKKTQEGLSGRSVRYIHVTMSKALHEAEGVDLVRKNVARFATPPKLDTKEREPMTAQEIQTFLGAVRGHKDEALYLLAVTSGMRRGELFGLKWEDLDLEGRRYKVQRSLDTYYGPAEERAPKTKSGRRSGILLPEVVDSLRVHRQRQRHERLVSGPRWVDNDYLFPTGRGTPQRANNVLYRSLYPLCEAAGLRRLTFTDLRHSCATTLALLSVHPKTAQRIMGHSSIAVTMNVYTHALDEMQEDAADRVREFLFGGTEADSETL